MSKGPIPWTWMMVSPLAQAKWRMVLGMRMKEPAGKALEASGCSTADVTPVDLWDYTGADCQTWTIEPIVGGAYKIIGTGSGKSLDVAGCSADRGADVIIWPFHGGSCQRWYFSPA